jgi:hypothetical protein
LINAEDTVQKESRGNNTGDGPSLVISTFKFVMKEKEYQMKYKIILGLSALLISWGSLADSAVTWQAPCAISPIGDSIVNTSGSLIEALNWGGTGDQTINGVTFIGQGGGGVTANSNSSSIIKSYSNSGVYTDGGVSTSFETLLDSFMWSGGGPTGHEFSLFGLTAGLEYMVQFFVSDDRRCCDHELSWFSGGGTESDHVRYDMSYAVTGMFTADAATQAFKVQGQYSAQLTGYQLRQVTTVPEPAIWALFGFGMIGLGFTRRRRTR